MAPLPRSRARIRPALLLIINYSHRDSREHLFLRSRGGIGAEILAIAITLFAGLVLLSLSACSYPMSGPKVNICTWFTSTGGQVFSFFFWIAAMLILLVLVARIIKKVRA